MLKQLDNEVYDNRNKATHNNPYSHIEDRIQENIKQKDRQVRPFSSLFQPLTTSFICIDIKFARYDW
mgnify:CR=1 FL=1